MHMHHFAFFSCLFFTSSHPPSLSTPSSPFYSFPFPFHLLQMSALEQEDLVPDNPGEDDEWQDKDPPPSLVSGNVPSHSYSIFKGSSSLYLTTPSSCLSHPSGLPQDTITNLTFDELLCNSMFTRYVSLVNILVNKSPQQCKL